MTSALKNITELARKAPASAKMPSIPRKIKHACELLLAGDVQTISAAARRVNLTREHLSKSLRKPTVQAFLAQRTRQTIATGQMRAAAVLTELLDCDSLHVRKDVAIHTLRLAGISPPDSPQIINQIRIIPGYNVVLPPGRQFIEGQVVEVEDFASDDAD